MFSRLDSLFIPHVRQAEAPDARLGIHRHEEEAGGKGRGHKNEDEAEDIWADDRAQVSVVALKAFLGGILSEADGARQPYSGGAADEDAAGPGPQPSATPSALAAQAYRRTYRATHGGEGAAPPPEALPQLSLTEGEMRAMRRMEADLAVLEKRGVDVLALRRGNSLLESLADAVAEALAQSNL